MVRDKYIFNVGCSSVKTRNFYYFLYSLFFIYFWYRVICSALHIKGLILLKQPVFRIKL